MKSKMALRDLIPLMIVFCLITRFITISIKCVLNFLNQLQILIKIPQQFESIELFSANLTIYFIVSITLDSL